MKKIKLKDNEVRISYKSQIKLSNEQKKINNNTFFILNQLYNYAMV